MLIGLLATEITVAEVGTSSYLNATGTTANSFPLKQYYK